MTSEELKNAIFYIHANAEFSFTETDLETLEWHSVDVKKPSIEEIIAAIPLAKAKANAELESLESKKQELLARLGITEDEAKLLLA